MVCLTAGTQSPQPLRTLQSPARSGIPNAGRQSSTIVTSHAPCRRPSNSAVYWVPTPTTTQRAPRCCPSSTSSTAVWMAINASDAMPRGGKITVRIENAPVTSDEWAERWDGRPGEYVALGVTDTGTGISAEVLEHVFEPFFTTKGVGQGSGLGLSMVHGFAHQSGGFVTVESEVGTGTTVVIYLPKAPVGQTVAEADHGIDKLPKSDDEIVLLVEDDFAVRDATRMVLQRLGYTVLTASDGASALAIASNTERIDLLLSDLVLPGGLNGIEICHLLREQRPGLKCLLMTGYASVPVQQLPEGTEIISKPVAIGEFAAKWRQVLDS